MNKVICDICGTAYPETASQCPICGHARSADQKIIADSADGEATAGRTHVRGGRFSKANVRKRNRAVLEEEHPAEQPVAPVPNEPPMEQDHDNPPSNKGLIAAVVILLLAVLAVSAYIVAEYVVPMFTQPYETTLPAEPTETETVTSRIPCTALQIPNAPVVLEATGRAWLLEVQPLPADTTDAVTYVSSDPLVAQVDANGRITAVNNGQAVITVTCGAVQKQVSVTCSFAQDTTEAPIPQVTDPSETTEPPLSEHVELALNREDITLGYKGESFRFSAGKLSNAQIAWSSEDPQVASIKNGVVTAEGGGVTTIIAEYDGQKASCIIRCSFDDPDRPTEEETEPAPAQGEVHISHEDVTIVVGETFELTLRDKDGNLAAAEWSSDDESVCTVSGNTVTGVGSGIAYVECTYNGESFRCVVRIH